MPKNRYCTVADYECTAPANYEEAYTRGTCYACGDPVCVKCSRRRVWYTYGRKRICLRCIEENKKGETSEWVKWVKQFRASGKCVYARKEYSHRVACGEAAKTRSLDGYPACKNHQNSVIRTGWRGYIEGA